MKQPMTGTGPQEGASGLEPRLNEEGPRAGATPAVAAPGLRGLERRRLRPSRRASPSGSASGRAAPDAQPAHAARSDETRAHEHGRGRRAAAPWDIPWRGWKDILWRTYEGINDNRLLSVAAGVVFYSLLALFPAIAAFVSLYGLFADPGAIDAHVSQLSGILPGGALDILHEELQAAHRQQGREPQHRLRRRPALRAVERQRRHEGDHRRAQRRL